MIHFSCACGEQYHAQSIHAGKYLRCRSCGQRVLIAYPAPRITPPQIDKPPVPAPKPAGPLINKDRVTLQNSALFVALVLSVLGCLLPSTRMVALLAGGATFGWWYMKRIPYLWGVTISGVLGASAMGFFALLAAASALNLLPTNGAAEAPPWLLALDNFVVDAYTKLHAVMDWSVPVYALVLTSCLLATALFPSWHVIQKFTAWQLIHSRLTTFLVVVTTFTFFASQPVNEHLEQFWLEDFRVAVRDSLLQERRTLLAKAIVQRVKTEQPEPVSVKDSTHIQQVQASSTFQKKVSAGVNSTEVQVAAREDAQRTMFSWSEIPESDLVAPSVSADGESAVRMSWVEEKWQSDFNHATKVRWEEQKKRAKNWPLERRTVAKEAHSAATEAKIVADEAVETAKSIFSTAFASLFDGIPQELVKTYVSEFIGVIAEYVFEKASLPDLIKRLFTKPASTHEPSTLLEDVAAWWEARKAKPIPAVVHNPESKEPEIGPAATGTRPATGQDNVTNKQKLTCGTCRAVVPPTSHIGQRCPWCHVLWVTEKVKKDPAFCGTCEDAPTRP